MKKVVVLFAVVLIMAACEEKRNPTTDIVANDTIVKTDSIVVSDTSNTGEAIHENELNYIVSAAEGYNYDSLRTIAIKAAELLHFKFDTMDRYYNPKKGIVLPDNYGDEIWAGQYLFRRTGESIVSVEMRNAYIDTAMEANKFLSEKFYGDTTRMFVFAAMYTEKNKADSLSNILKAKFPQIKIIASKIYMGCMH